MHESCSLFEKEPLIPIFDEDMPLLIFTFLSASTADTGLAPLELFHLGTARVVVQPFPRAFMW